MAIASVLLTSCDENSLLTSWNATVRINTAALYDELGYRSEMSQMIANGMLPSQTAY
jgi:hypothetical protein